MSPDNGLPDTALDYFGDWGLVDHLGSALQRNRSYMLTPAQREQLRGYLWRALPSEDFHPAGGDEAKRQRVLDAIEEALRGHVIQGNFAADRPTAQKLFDEVVGLGPIADLLADDEVTSVTVSETDRIMVERLDRPGLSFTPGFASDHELMRVIENLAARAGRTISAREPILDLAWDRPPTRVHINLLSGKGPFIAWRRGRSEAVSMESYLSDRRLSLEMADFFRHIMQSDLGIAVTGVPGTGKTTMVEMLLHLTTPKTAGHVVIIEETPEMVTHDLPHVSVFRVPPVRPGEEFPIGLTGLTLAALRMNARRLVVGEVRGAEAGALVSIMPGFHGVTFTVHATSPEAALERLVSIAQMGGGRPPSPYESGQQEHLVRRQVANGIRVIVTMARLPDGRIIVDRVDWLDGLADDRDFQVTNIFQSYKTVGDDTITVTWKRNDDFALPASVVACMATAEVADETRRREQFRETVEMVQRAADAGRYERAMGLLEDAWERASKSQRKDMLSRFRSVARRGLPSVWEEATAQAQQTKKTLDELLEIRAWNLASNLLRGLADDPVTRVAFAELARFDEYRERVITGQRRMTEVKSDVRNAETLIEDERLWDALWLLEDMGQRDMEPDYEDWVTSTRLSVMEKLSQEAEGDAAQQLATLILRSVSSALAPELTVWAKKHVEETGELSVLLRAVGPAQDDEDDEDDEHDRNEAPDELYTRACRAFAAQDWTTAREALVSVQAERGADYRSTARLLNAIPEGGEDV